MSLETRATAAAEGLRTATAVDVEAGLARLRRTHHRRTATRVAGAALLVAAVVGAGALVLDGTDRAAPPVDRGPVENLDTEPGWHRPRRRTRPGRARASSDGPLAARRRRGALPAWQAFDQDTGRFLFSRCLFDRGGGIPCGARGMDVVRTMRVLAPGREKPVATIHCDGAVQHDALVRTGPGRGHDAGHGGSRAARTPRCGGSTGRCATRSTSPVATGEASPTSSGPPTAAGSPSAPSGAGRARLPRRTPHPPRGAERRPRLPLRPGRWRPELLYRQRARARWTGPPVLTDLAWSPDGERLGLVSSTYCHHPQPESPTLLSLDVESGQAQTLYQFDDTYNDYMTATHGFAWSPDGTRIAVTSGTGITEISSDGQPLTATRGSGQGPSGLARAVGRLRIRRTNFGPSVTQ